MNSVSAFCKKASRFLTASKRLCYSVFIGIVCYHTRTQMKWIRPIEIGVLKKNLIIALRATDRERFHTTSTVGAYSTVEQHT